MLICESTHFGFNVKMYAHSFSPAAFVGGKTKMNAFDLDTDAAVESCVLFINI